jgi:RimJ/RimL family protein N-acetyltransferase
MLMSDADDMLRWKNDPDTRKYAILSHDEIKLEDHLKWLENNVQHFQIIEFKIDGIKKALVAGAVRIYEGEISIWIDRAFRNRGVATEVIKAVATCGMTAKIVDGNMASLRAFIKADFLPINHIDNYYLLKL